MTVKLSEYGITGPWSEQVCDGCGKRRSCTGGQVGPLDDPEVLFFCVICAVKDIERMEEEMAEEFIREQHWNEQLERGELDE